MDETEQKLKRAKLFSFVLEFLKGGFSWCFLFLLFFFVVVRQFIFRRYRRFVIIWKLKKMLDSYMLLGKSNDFNSIMWKVSHTIHVCAAKAYAWTLLCCFWGIWKTFSCFWSKRRRVDLAFLARNFHKSWNLFFFEALFEAHYTKVSIKYQCYWFNVPLRHFFRFENLRFCKIRHVLSKHCCIRLSRLNY